jgi:thermitase
MKTVLNGFIVIVLGVAAAGMGWAQKPSEEHVPGRLLVQAAPGVDDAAAEQIVALVGAKVHHSIDGLGVKVLEVPEQALDGVSLMLQRSGRFTFVERDFVAHGAATPNDPSFASQWHLNKIQAPSAWGITTGTGVPMAIIDSGADMTHPDLKPKLLPGWNFLTGNSNASDTGALGGHGTAVSGAAAAATNNLTGVAGVGWSNMIMPLVVLSSSDYASYSNIASAINYAADHGVRIISISILGSASSTTLQSAVNYAWSKGAVVFAAAGNNSSSAPVYPAACTNVVAVSATEPTDTFSSFSNYGNWITLSAPGDLILTTNLGGGYGSWYGTSLATPIAAAVGALALAANPSLTASALVTLLKQNSDDLGAPGYDQYFGWGRVNAYRAVQAAKGGATTTDTTAPVVSITSPISGATVKGTFLVQGTATDNIGVKTIQFYVDASLVSSAAASPFAFSWNSASVANGTHTLMVKAYDAANNVRSASVTVNVNNDKTAPTVSIASPTTGATVSGTIAVTGSAADNVGVTKVQLFVDGVAIVSGTASSFSFSWNTTTATDAVHTVSVKAYDAAGNVGSAAVSVTVKNTGKADTTAPVVSITSPISGATVKGSFMVQGTATDNVGVSKIQFYVDGRLISNLAASPFALSWNSTGVANGTHTLTVKAYDAANNVGAASVAVNVNN